MVRHCLQGDQITAKLGKAGFDKSSTGGNDFFPIENGAPVLGAPDKMVCQKKLGVTGGLIMYRLNVFHLYYNNKIMATIFIAKTCVYHPRLKGDAFPAMDL